MVAMGKSVFFVLILSVWLCTPADASEPAALSPPCTHTSQVPALEGLSAFVKNVGQCAPEVLYYADAPWGRLYIRDADIVLQFIEQTSSDPTAARASNVYVRFTGGRFDTVEEEEKGPAVLNILRGRDPLDWHREIPTFGKVRLRGISSGASVVLAAAGSGHGGWWIEGGRNRTPPRSSPWNLGCPTDGRGRISSLRPATGFLRSLLPAGCSRPAGTWLRALPQTQSLPHLRASFGAPTWGARRTTTARRWPWTPRETSF